MRAILAKLFVGRCALLSGAAMVAMIASDGRPSYVVIRSTPGEAWLVQSARGELRFVRRYVTPAGAGGTGFNLTEPDRVTYTRAGGSGWLAFAPHEPAFGRSWTDAWRTGQVGVRIGGVQYTVRGASLSLPYPVLIAGGVVPPMMFVARRVLRRRGRGHASLCSQCGYDLRASVTRCPECGTRFGSDDSAGRGKG